MNTPFQILAPIYVNIAQAADDLIASLCALRNRNSYIERLILRAMVDEITADRDALLGALLAHHGWTAQAFADVAWSDEGDAFEALHAYVV